MTLLRVENLSKQFGGIAAVDELSFEVEAGTIHSIIGPNGAGKTTVLNLISGVYTPSRGAIYLDGAAMAGKPPHEQAACGLSRTFQNLQIFTTMSALENVMVGRHLRLDRRLLPSLLRFPGVVRRDDAAREHCIGLMEFVGCGRYVDSDAASLPYGALKRLEIARALATEPKLILLDEPAAGLNATESREVDAVIKKIAAQGITVILVEHDMKMVMGISDRILVLNYGRKLTEGTPAEIAAHPEVISAYLGAAA